MKSINRKIRLAGKILLGVVCLISVFSMFGLIPGLFGVGIAYATGTIVSDGSGTLSQQEAVTQGVVDMSDVERKVSIYKPYQTPLLTLLSDESNRLSVESWKKEYYAVDSRGLYATITASTEPSNNVVTLTLSDNTMFTRYNTVLFPAIVTATTKINSGKMLMGIVTSVGDNNTITVKLVNPGTSLASTDFNTNPDSLCYRLGSAHNEKAASAAAWGINPAIDYNYVQLFMEQIEETEFQKLMKKEADWGIADLKRMAIEDFKIQRERTFLGGVRGETTVSVDGQSQKFYTCGGFLNDSAIPRMTGQDLSDIGTSSATFVTWLKTIFTGNNGSRKRYLLGGADVIEAIEKVKVDNKWLLSKESEVVLGIDFVKMVSTFGILDISYYEQLDLLGKQKTAIVIDRSNMYIGDLKGKGFNVRKLDYKSSGIAAVDANVIEQCSTMLIKNKNTHHVIECVA